MLTNFITQFICQKQKHQERYQITGPLLSIDDTISYVCYQIWISKVRPKNNNRAYYHYNR
jgi:hypothetical protein